MLTRHFELTNVMMLRVTMWIIAIKWLFEWYVLHVYVITRYGYLNRIVIRLQNPLGPCNGPEITNRLKWGFGPLPIYVITYTQLGFLVFNLGNQEAHTNSLSFLLEPDGTRHKRIIVPLFDFQSVSVWFCISDWMMLLLLHALIRTSRIDCYVKQYEPYIDDLVDRFCMRIT